VPFSKYTLSPIEIYKIEVIIMVTMKELMNLKRKIKRARTVKTLERYTKQLDTWLEEIRAASRPQHRHSYSYDQFEKGLLRRSGLHE
jgi:hypothetical protein